MSGTESSDKVTGQSELASIDHSSLVRTTNLVLTLVVAGLSVLKWAVAGSNFLPVAGMLVTLLGVCNGTYLAMGGSAIVVARLIIIGLVVGLGFAIFDSGGFDGPIVLLAPVIPVLSFLLIGPRVGWAAAIAMVLGLLGLLTLHLVDAVPPSPHSATKLQLARFIALASTGLVATWVIWAFAVTARALGQRNEVLANTDHLTGIANRRSSENVLNQEILRAQRSGQYLSLIIVDVDFFKRYNDSNGHQAGDECLRRVAAVMQRSALRPTDVVGRFGGEEFIAVLPDTSLEGACVVAERMRQGLLDQRIPYAPGKPEILSMTVGVTSLPGKEIDSVSGLISLADQALYQGKEEGRNTVVIKVSAGSE